MTRVGVGGAEGMSGATFARSDLRRGRTEVAVSNDPGGCVCRGTVAGIGGAEMSVDWMTRSRKGEQK
jgi:hypothetical protein